ncbi:hypothetical protein [Aliiruegeria lutimaris]|nr:hypothetical protein [Aliiruegeria lutimaris]
MSLFPWCWRRRVQDACALGICCGTSCPGSAPVGLLEGFGVDRRNSGLDGIEYMMAGEVPLIPHLQKLFVPEFEVMPLEKSYPRLFNAIHSYSDGRTNR